MKFIFYASQFRPSKNVFSLLKAYLFLLRKRYFHHKLILTGKLEKKDPVYRFINQHHLQNDVLILSGLTVSELAACYKLADISINPSMFEGGCPFTFTESLSVGTPTIMADIPVTTEIITNKTLQKQMLFNPFSWEDMANRIEWAIKNRDLLLKQQLPVYEALKQRSWSHVVDDYLQVLSRIAHSEDIPAAINPNTTEVSLHDA